MYWLAANKKGRLANFAADASHTTPWLFLSLALCIVFFKSARKKEEDVLLKEAEAEIKIGKGENLYRRLK
jgi:hypothetical protein